MKLKTKLTAAKQLKKKKKNVPKFGLQLMCLNSIQSKVTGHMTGSVRKVLEVLLAHFVFFSGHPPVAMPEHGTGTTGSSRNNTNMLYLKESGLSRSSVSLS